MTDLTWGDQVLEASTVCFVGDTHGDAGFVMATIKRAAAKGCHLLVQVGDFGFWPGQPGQRYLRVVERELDRAGSTMLAIDGNHDWHEWLVDLQPGPDGLNRISPHLWHAPRGAVFPLPGAARCLAVGGAPSIDRNRRVEGVDWWAGETLSHADVMRCFDSIDGGPIDVVVSHDVPREVPLTELSLWSRGDAHRRVLSAIAARARPRRWFAGHYHRRVTAPVTFEGSPCLVEVLDCNEAPAAQATLTVTKEDLANRRR